MSVTVTNDGARYLAAGDGQRVARPFHFRWLLPKLCGTDLRRWSWAAQISTVGLAALSAWWVALHGLDWHYQLAAPFLVVGLAGVWKFNRAYPVLVDAPAMFLALLAACLLEAGLWPLAVVVAVLTGCVKETAPAFAAAWSGPLLLVGLIAPLVRLLIRSGDDVLDAHNRWILDHPLAAARQYHAGRWTDLRLMVAPWGALLVALYQPDARLALVLALAYAQLLVATDSVRLYQWAFPTLLVAALGVIPAPWLVLAVVAHVANPWAGDGN